MEKRKVRNGNVYIIEAHLQKFDNQLPYFSVTHEVWHATKKGEINKRYKEPWCCGACGEDVEKAFPELKDLFDFHLRDINGEPMYTLENGLYFIKENDVNAVKKHFRVDDATELMKIKTKEELQKYLVVNGFYDRWKKEADNLIKKYNLQIKYN